MRGEGPPRELADMAERLARRFRGNGFDRCVQRSEILAQAMREAGREPRILRCRGYLGDPAKADRRWRRLPAPCWTHYVVLDVASGTTVDMSARQLNELSTCPDYAPMAELSARWGSVAGVD